MVFIQQENPSSWVWRFGCVRSVLESSGCSIRAPPAGGFAVKQRNAGKFTASSTETSGARRAAGRKPASASSTEPQRKSETKRRKEQGLKQAGTSASPGGRTDVSLTWWTDRRQPHLVDGRQPHLVDGRQPHLVDGRQPHLVDGQMYGAQSEGRHAAATRATRSSNTQRQHEQHAAATRSSNTSDTQRQHEQHAAATRATRSGNTQQRISHSEKQSNVTPLEMKTADHSS
ncbi:hypothetical protein D5F01_LYC24281 [Larimichthys crocea]|uniref:Uncharacterized protein n=1 Tax=Larimichthys crocea TaxID=215358 RepID=A0A6G0HFE2_LARCR|nr:hypothetical protein D5F01_LYC24281 [Larimichthys crocea]